MSIGKLKVTVYCMVIIVEYNYMSNVCNYHLCV